MERRESEEPVPRSYQLEILERAEQMNTIVCLETGCGKTLVAVLLIRSLSRLFRKPEKGICVFLAPNVQLCHQQAGVIERYTDLHICICVGGSSIESWPVKLEKNEVFVMTPEILLRSLRHGFIIPDLIELLVFDDCHHAAKSHPYANIMTEFYHKPAFKCPRILGLTASPIVGKGKLSSVKDVIERLEDTLRSKVYNVADPAELDKFIPSSNLKVRKYAITSKGPFAAITSKMTLLFENLTRELLELRLIEERRVTQQIFGSLKYCLSELGLWCGKQAAQIFLEGCESGCNAERNFLTHVLNSFKPDDDGKQELPENDDLSAKVLLLLQVLDDYKFVENLRGIVFVERVIAAKVLSLLLNRRLPYVNCQCVASHRNNLRGMSRTVQNDTLKLFRSGKVKLLVATNVAEEGLDVQSCSLVIRFDMPKTERSNIQSRGRARQPGSDYVIFIESGNSEQEKLLESLLDGEKQMQDELRGKDPSRDAEVINRQKETYCVESTGAIVNIDSSVSLLHSYCSTLKCIEREPEFHFWKDKDGIVCSIKLPESAQANYIVGSGCQTQEMAKRLACLEACKKLHVSGGLTDNLLPIASTDSQAEVSVADDEETMELYETVVPDVLKGDLEVASSGELKLDSYVLSMHFDGERPHRNFALFLPSCQNENITLSLELDISRGRKLVIELTTQQNLNFNGLQVSWAKHFHEKIFSALWNSGSTNLHANWSSSRAFFLLPLLPGKTSAVDVDWKCVRSGNPPPPVFFEEEPLHFANCSVPVESVRSGLVSTKHNREGEPVLYSILSILDGMTSESPFVTPHYSSYHDYFLERHNVKIRHLTQPLLKVKRLRRPQNFLLQRSTNASDTIRFEELPAELCTVLSLEADYSVMNSLTVLPSVMHRVESLLCSRQLRKLVGIPISETMLLTALTSASCNESFNLERLELLGDSFLKLAVTFHFYALHPEKREGFLSRKRSEMVCNDHLFKLALEKKLEMYVREGQFDPYDWPIPGFSRIICSVERGKSPACRKCNKGHRSLRRKSIADVVEAITGAYVVDNSANAALKFMTWLGFELSTNCVVPVYSYQTLEDEDQKKFDDLERILGYTFLDRNFLVEAFTHASYHQRSFQRLEHLGDAVLDYLIVLHLYATFPLLKPGLLNDLKSSTVNNEWFAYAAVRHKLHQYMLCSSDRLRTEISSFLARTTERFEDWQVNKSPKVLSDLLESLAGALFLDTSGDLSKVWEVLKPILDPVATPESLVLHPIRELQELSQLKGFSLEFSQAGVTVGVDEGTSIVGTGRGLNSKIARKQSASDALSQLKALGFEHPRQELLIAVKPVRHSESDASSIIANGWRFNVNITTTYDDENQADNNDLSSRFQRPEVSTSATYDSFSALGSEAKVSHSEERQYADSSGVKNGKPPSVVQRTLLQEHCTKLRLPNPVYSLHEEIGPPHMKQFTYRVSILVTDTKRVDMLGDPKTDVKRAKDSAAKYLLDWFESYEQILT